MRKYRPRLPRRAAQCLGPSPDRGAGPRDERGEALVKKYGILTTTNNVEAARQADIVVLSVKPQVLHGVLNNYRRYYFKKATGGLTGASVVATEAGQSLPFQSQDDTGICQLWCLRWQRLPLS